MMSSSSSHHVQCSEFPSPIVGDDALKLRIMTYNIRYDCLDDQRKGDGWRDRVEHVVGIIKNYSADIIGLQETLFHQINEIHNGLAQLNESYQWYGIGRNGGNKGEFSPIFWNEKVLEKLDGGTFWLSFTPFVEGSIALDAKLPRICTWGRFKFKGTEQFFYFFNTHWDHQGVKAQNYSSVLMRRAMHLITSNNPSPIFMTGDLNVSPIENAFNTLISQGESDEVYQYVDEKGIKKDTTGSKIVLASAHFLDPKFKVGEKITSFTGFEEGAYDILIDYILFSRDDPKINVLRFGILECYYKKDAEKRLRFPSDHRPVLADFAIRK